MKLGPPDVVDVGEIEVITGIGLLTASVWEFEVPPPGVGLKTVMVEVPVEIVSVAVIAVVS